MIIAPRRPFGICCRHLLARAALAMLQERMAVWSRSRPVLFARRKGRLSSLLWVDATGAVADEDAAKLSACARVRMMSMRPNRPARGQRPWAAVAFGRSSAI